MKRFMLEFKDEIKSWITSFYFFFINSIVVLFFLLNEKIYNIVFYIVLLLILNIVIPAFFTLRYYNNHDGIKYRIKIIFIGDPDDAMNIKDKMKKDISFLLSDFFDLNFLNCSNTNYDMDIVLKSVFSIDMENGIISHLKNTTMLESLNILLYVENLYSNNEKELYFLENGVIIDTMSINDIKTNNIQNCLSDYIHLIPELNCSK